MSNRPPFTITCTTDLLALVPYAFGFQPEDSLTMLNVGESGVHARVDLPRDEVEVRTAVATLVQAAVRNSASLVALIAYSHDHDTSLEAVGRLRHALERHGVTVPVTVRAEADRWYSLDGCDDACCPVEGTPYDLTCHPFTAQLVLEGRVSLGSREELAGSLVCNDPALLDAVEAASYDAMARYVAARREPMGPTPMGLNPIGLGPTGIVPGEHRHLVQEGHWVRGRVRRYLSRREPLDADEVGRLLVALVPVEVRDVAWSEMTHTNAAVHVDLWREVVRVAPLHLVAAPAALLGFAAWLSGDGALAWCAVERCQEGEPDYSMAGLLTHALATALPPSSWSPVPGEELPLFAG